MLILVGEGDEFGLDAGTIAGAYALDLSIVEWGVWETSAQAFVNCFVGVGDPAGELGEAA